LFNTILLQVVGNCDKLTMFSPIGKIRHNHFTDQAGIMITCQNNGMIEVRFLNVFHTCVQKTTGNADTSGVPVLTPDARC
jgi:hypothetical protein